MITLKDDEYKADKLWLNIGPMTLRIAKSSTGVSIAAFRTGAGELVDSYTLNDEDFETEEDSDELCGTCDGSGEGQYDGSTCSRCKGTGVLPVEVDDEEGASEHYRLKQEEGLMV